MNEINKEEMFGNLRSFLKSKGIELQEGSYSDGIRKSCDMLADTVNLSQRGFEHAKNAMGKGLNQLRQTIHECTAPRSAEPPGQQAHAKPNGAKAQSAKTAQASAKKTSAKRAKTRGK